MKDKTKKSRVKPQIDRISSLPESVLAHILSFLPTKDSVATSLLSKRWEFTWKYTSNLHFRHVGDRVSSGRKTDKNNATYMKFTSFVTRVLLLHEVKCLDVMSFEFLDKDMVYDPFAMDNLNNWFATAVARKIKSLKVYGHHSCVSEFSLPSCILKCNSLESLDLGYDVRLSPSGVILLPKLRVLTMKNVRFESDESFRKLISGCLSLHTLYMEEIKHDNVGVFTVHSQTLKSLTISSKFIYSNDNAYDSKLEISAPALKYLHLYDLRFKAFFVKIPSLVEAKITLVESKHCNDRKELFDCHWKAVDYLIHRLYYVKTLILDAYAYNAVSHSGLSPSFLRLSKLTVPHCCGYKKLLDLLQGSNSLETLILEESPYYHRVHEKWTKPNEVPFCVLSCLKVVSLGGFSDREDQIAMVEYILQNAGALEEMSLKMDHMDAGRIFQSFRKVLNFERRSKKCRIEFS